MEPREDEQQKDEQARRDEEEKRRPRFRPTLERLEERIAPSGLSFTPNGFVHTPWGRML